MPKRHPVCSLKAITEAFIKGFDRSTSSGAREYSPRFATPSRIIIKYVKKRMRTQRSFYRSIVSVCVANQNANYQKQPLDHGNNGRITCVPRTLHFTSRVKLITVFYYPLNISWHLHWNATESRSELFQSQGWLLWFCGSLPLFLLTNYNYFEKRLCVKKLGTRCWHCNQCRTYFGCFLFIPHVHGVSCHSLRFCWNVEVWEPRNWNYPRYLSGRSRELLPTTFHERALCILFSLTLQNFRFRRCLNFEGKMFAKKRAFSLISLS